MRNLKYMSKVPFPPLFIVFLILIILALGVILFLWGDGGEGVAIAGGLVAGLAIYVMSFSLDYKHYKEIDRFRNLGVKEVLVERKNSNYYRKLLKNAKEKVFVMGTSCSRFIDDFMNEESDSHVLLEALASSKGLTIELLVPTEKHMDVESKRKFKAIEKTLKPLIEKYEGRIAVRRYPFSASNSLVRIDKELIVGPVFAGIDSKHCPAIHLDVSSEYARKYIEYYKRTFEGSDEF